MFAIEETDLPDDLFSVFFKCQSYETPWRALLAHAIALQRPLLAVLAACKEVCVESYSHCSIHCYCGNRYGNYSSKQIIQIHSVIVLTIL